MDTLRIMQIGIGGYGMQYLNPILSGALPKGCELVGVVDPIAEKSPVYEQIKSRGIPVYGSIEDFYAQDQADLCIIAAPIGLHARYSIYAMEHGSHVLCEKPVAATVNEAEQMRAAEKKTGKFVAVGFQWSFCDAMLAAKRDYLAGKFGKALAFKAHILWRRDWEYFARNNWAGKFRDASGGWILDSVAQNATAHYLHNMYFMMGTGIDVSAFPQKLRCELYRANEIENFDTCALRVKTDVGAEILYLAAHPLETQTPVTLEYRYENCTLRYENDLLIGTFKDGHEKNYGPVNQNATTMRKLSACIQAICNGGAIPCTIQTALAHLTTINMLADFVPIYDFPSDMVVRDPVQRLTYVPQLREALETCYAREALPFEAGYAWAHESDILSVPEHYSFSGARILQNQ